MQLVRRAQEGTLLKSSSEISIKEQQAKGMEAKRKRERERMGNCRKLTGVKLGQIPKVSGWPG